jgi:hypothetical protein
MSKKFPRVARLPRSAGTVKVPKLPPLRYGLFTPEGQLVRVCETSDPRNRICSTFNGLRYLASDAIARPITDDTQAALRRKAVSQ